MSERKRIAVLISGRGSNMAALIAAAEDPDYPAEIALVLSDKPDAAGLGKAGEHGTAVDVIDRRLFADKPTFEAALTARLAEASVDFICLAGFMRILSTDFVEHWRDRILNIHPSLLPSFRGIDTHQRAIEAGVKLHGCTVHFVRPEVDDGPIIAQAAVPVFSGDTADALAARVLEVEHHIYAMALKLVASGQARVEGDRVVFDEGARDWRPLIEPDIDAMLPEEWQ